MTIVVATTASDGIVLASDSRTTLVRGPLRYRVGTDFAQKIFVPYDGVGIASYGTAVVGNRSIIGLMERFVAERIQSGLRPSPGDLAVLVEEFFSEAINAEALRTNQEPRPGILGFLIAGYDFRGVGQIVEVLLPPSESRPAILRHPISTLSQGAVYRGRTRYIRRMLDGWDNEEGMEFVREWFDAAEGVDLDGFQDSYERSFGMLAHPPVSIQDALDYCCFVVRTTIDMERFTDGMRKSKGDIPICGGRVQALIVQRDSTRWVVQHTVKIMPGGAGEVG